MCEDTHLSQRTWIRGPQRSTPRMDAGRHLHGQRHGEIGLQQLPQNLINCIFDRVKRASGLKGVGQLRLVSKAWKACVLQYPTAVKCRFDNDHLRKVCSLLPNMTSISIHDTEYASIDVGALRMCTLLTHVKLAIKSPLGCQDHREPIQLQDLPPSVVSILVDRVYVDCNCYQLMTAAQAAAITRLSTRKSDYNPGNMWTWLGYLPNLEVLELAQANHWWSGDFDDLWKRGLGRLSALKSLILLEGTLSDAICNQHQWPSSLRELTLINVDIGHTWISSLISFTPHLTSLLLEGCSAAGGSPQHFGGLAAISTLRYLGHTDSSMAFLGLAGTSLQSLALVMRRRNASDQERELATLKIVNLPKLVQLKLAKLGRVHPGMEDIFVERLQGLRRLTLMNCGFLPFTLFRTTAMSSLRFLDLKDNMIQFAEVLNAREMCQISMAHFVKGLEDISKTILSLPNLVRVTGSSSIMHVGMKGLVPLKRAPRHIIELARKLGLDDCESPMMVAYKQDLMIRL